MSFLVLSIYISAKIFCIGLKVWIIVAITKEVNLFRSSKNIERIMVIDSRNDGCYEYVL